MEICVLDDLGVVEQFDHSEMVFHFLPILETHILYFFQRVNFVVNFRKHFVHCGMRSLANFFENFIFLVENFFDDILCFNHDELDRARR